MKPSPGPWSERNVLAFWRRVDKDGPEVRPGIGSCWVWTGSKPSDGYGRATGRGKQHLAHRMSWELANGPIPGGKKVLHRCDNHPCVRPSHLFVGTQRENIVDAAVKDRIRWGEQHPRAKLSSQDVAQIRRRLDRGELQRVIACDLGVGQSRISQIGNGERWRE